MKIRLLIAAMGTSICFLLSGCQKHGQPAVTASPAGPTAQPVPSTQAYGGESGGGGNKLQSKSASRAEVRELLNNYSDSLTAVFNLLDYAHWQVQATKVSAKKSGIDFEKHYVQKTKSKYFLAGIALANVSPKLFASKKNIFDAIKSYRANLLETGSCYDRSGTAVDASVVNTPAGTICFSLERILANESSKNIFVSVIAMAAHEYSHLLGTNEEEAVLVQTAVDRILEPNVQDNLKYWKSQSVENLKALKVHLYWAQLQLDQHESASSADICTALERSFSFSQQFFSLQQVMSGNGVRLYSLAGTASIDVIMMKLQNLYGFCYYTGAEEAALPPKSEKTIAAVAATKGLVTFNATEGVIRTIHRDDRSALQLEITDLASLLSSQIEIENSEVK